MTAIASMSMRELDHHAQACEKHYLSTRRSAQRWRDEYREHSATLDAIPGATRHTHRVLMDRRSYAFGVWRYCLRAERQARERLKYVVTELRRREAMKAYGDVIPFRKPHPRLHDSPYADARQRRQAGR